MTNFLIKSRLISNKNVIKINAELNKNPSVLPPNLQPFEQNSLQEMVF